MCEWLMVVNHVTHMRERPRLEPHVGPRTVTSNVSPIQADGNSHYGEGAWFTIRNSDTHYSTALWKDKNS